jgi:RNA polymerase sigma-54 factor
MTPQLQQAIKLLALSSMEIEAFIAEEVERNPVLENGTAEPVVESLPEEFAPLPPAESG